MFKSAQLLVIEPENMFPEHSEIPLEVCEPQELEIIIEELPGAPSGTKDPEPLEVVEEEKESKDDNDLKSDKWGWDNALKSGPSDFIKFIKEKLDEVPKHSGYSASAIERVIAYFEKLDDIISKAMKSDLDGKLDANQIEKIQGQIDDGLSRLYDRHHKLKQNSKSKRKPKKGEFDPGLVKEGQGRALGVQGIYITVPLFISTIGRVCINGLISAGHDIEATFKDQCEKYKLNDREKTEVVQFLADCGYPMMRDRGYLIGDKVDISDGKYDWSSQYQG